MKLLAIIAILVLVCTPEVFSYPISSASMDTREVREAARQHAKPLEAILVDGPFYIAGRTYYIADYMYGGEVTSSLVYDTKAGKFTADAGVIKKVHATRDLALLTLLDPLFYAPGEYSKIPVAAKYETQNVRNFAEFVSMGLQERAQLERFLQTYEKLAEDIALVNKITNSILYPEGAYAFSYSASPPHISVNIKEDINRNFSYEAFQELLGAYNKVYSDYEKLISELNTLAKNFEEYPVDTPIREKWGVVITTENLKEQIEMVRRNGDFLKQEIQMRADIPAWSYERKIEDSTRLAAETDKTYLPVLGLILILVLYYLLRSKRRPPKILIILLLLSQAGFAADIKIPAPKELISQKVKSLDRVEIKVFAKGLEEAKAKRILFGYPLLLEGEGVEVRGPYYIRNTSYYLYEIVKDGSHTGNGFLVNAETERLEAEQQLVFQAIKARFVSELIADRPLYTVDADAIEKAAANATPPLDIFLTNLSINIREGKKIEQKLVEKPDFKNVKELAEHYTAAFMLLRNIGRLAPEEEAMQVTAGLFSKMNWFEAYARAIKGLSADEYLAGRTAMYRGRTLNRLPVIQQVAAIGYEPSLAQLIQDLTSDLIYDNYFLWRLGRVADPSMFARLAYKEGTVTFPTMVNQTE